MKPDNQKVLKGDLQSLMIVEQKQMDYIDELLRETKLLSRENLDLLRESAVTERPLNTGSSPSSRAVADGIVTTQVEGTLVTNQRAILEQPPTYESLFGNHSYNSST